MESVAAGYRLTIYDYTNDVMVRDEIERILESVSPERRRELEGELEGVDELFRGGGAGTRPRPDGPRRSGEVTRHPNIARRDTSSCETLLVDQDRLAFGG